MRAVTIFAVSLAALPAMPAAAAEPRIALVIGNNEYDSGLRRLDTRRAELVELGSRRLAGERRAG